MLRTDPLRLAALVAGLAAYGLAGTPAPSAPGPAELVGALGLVAAAGVAMPAALLSGALLRRPDADAVAVMGCFAFVLLLWPPLLRGAALGWGPADMVRDLLPLLFLFLPVLLTPLLDRAGAVWLDRLAFVLAGVGVAFALRWWRSHGFHAEAVGVVAYGEKGLFLLKSAALPFAAVWCGLAALDRLRRPDRPLGLAAGLVLAAAGALCLAALAAAVHRAALVMAVLALLAGALLLLRGRILPWLLLAAGLLAAGLVWHDTLAGLLRLFLHKTEAVGANSRLEEAAAVLGQVSRSLPSLLFGDGWGALLANPAAGGQRVSFTHNAGSYFLLKGGLLGLLAATAYLLVLMGEGAVALRRHPILVLALLPSMMNGLLLHTSYKYLCFGMLLVLLRMAARIRI